MRYWKITGVSLTKTGARPMKTRVRWMRTPVREAKTGVRPVKTGVRKVKTRVSLIKTRVFGGYGSFFGCFLAFVALGRSCTLRPTGFIGWLFSSVFSLSLGSIVLYPQYYFC